jgi:hypothetical protein
MTGLRMSESAVEKQPDRAAVWIFQEAEVVSGGEAIGFNGRINSNGGAGLCTLRSQTYSFSTTLHF